MRKKKILTPEHKRKISKSMKMSWSNKQPEKEFYMDVIEQIEVLQYDANLTAQELQDLLNGYLRKGYQVKHILTEKCFIVFNIPKRDMVKK